MKKYKKFKRKIKRSKRSYNRQKRANKKIQSYSISRGGIRL